MKPIAGDGGCEAYTAIMWSGILSRERDNPAEAEAVDKAEGNMLRTVMRGATALPWSETPLRMKGTHRNLGDLTSPKPLWRSRPRREAEEAKPSRERRGVGRLHSVRWAAPRSGGLKSLRRSDEERRIQKRG